jgi:hypothetical protein
MFCLSIILIKGLFFYSSSNYSVSHINVPIEIVVFGLSGFSVGLLNIFISEHISEKRYNSIIKFKLIVHRKVSPISKNFHPLRFNKVISAKAGIQNNS